MILNATTPLQNGELDDLLAYWEAANYLTVAQIYLRDNPLLREPLRAEHIKPRLLGHWGTSPGLNLVYAHLNRLIRAHRRRTCSTSPGPGHGGPAVVANVYLEGTYSEIYPEVSRRRGRAARASCASSRRPAASRATSACRRPARSTRAASSATRSSTRSAPRSTTPTCSSPASSATARPRPAPLEGSLEGHPLPRSRRATAPCCRSCTSTSTRSPAPPCSAARRRATCSRLLRGPRLRAACSSRATTRASVHRDFAAALDDAYARDPRDPAAAARGTGGRAERPRWPAIVLRTPKGWTGPHEVDGVAGRGHLPLPPGAAARACARTPSTSPSSRRWLRSYRPEERFDADGALVAGAGRAGARRRPADGRAAARQRRPPARRRSTCPTSAGYALPRRARRRAARGVDARARRAAARRLRAQRAAAQLPPLLPRRDELQPARRGVRGRGPLPARRAARRRARLAATAA